MDTGLSVSCRRPFIKSERNPLLAAGIAFFEDIILFPPFQDFDFDLRKI
jgi:hypothetical protein